MDPRFAGFDPRGNSHKHIMLHTISVLVENKFGVLARVAGMISGRGFNIDSLNVCLLYTSRCV